MQKFTMDDAKKILRGREHYAMHISWFSPSTGYQGTNLQAEYPDCSYVLLINDPDLHWRDPAQKGIFGLVIDNGQELAYREKYGMEDG